MVWYACRSTHIELGYCLYLPKRNIRLYRLSIAGSTRREAYSLHCSTTEDAVAQQYKVAGL